MRIWIIILNKKDKMKIGYLIWAFLICGSLYITITLVGIEKNVGQLTDPAFNYLEFEMPESRDFSKRMFSSIHEKGMVDKVQESLDVDFYYILFYVSSAILGAFLLLKNLNIEKRWAYILIGILGIVAGFCDYMENSNLEILLNNWEEGARDGAVEKAKKYAQIKFAIILPLIVSVLLGWGYVSIKKLFLMKK